MNRVMFPMTAVYDFVALGSYWYTPTDSFARLYPPCVSLVRVGIAPGRHPNVEFFPSCASLIPFIFLGSFQFGSLHEVLTMTFADCRRFFRAGVAGSRSPCLNLFRGTLLSSESDRHPYHTRRYAPDWPMSATWQHIAVEKINPGGFLSLTMPLHPPCMDGRRDPARSDFSIRPVPKRFNRSDSTNPQGSGGTTYGSLQKQHAPRCVSPAAKMRLDKRWFLKAAPRRSMLPDAFSRPRKMHLDERWIPKAAPRRSMLPDASSRPRNMHLDKRWILKAAPRRSMLPDAFSRLRKMHLDERWILKQLLEGACSQMRFPGSEKCI